MPQVVVRLQETACRTVPTRELATQLTLPRASLAPRAALSYARRLSHLLRTAINEADNVTNLFYRRETEVQVWFRNLRWGHITDTWQTANLHPMNLTSELML